MDNESSVFRKFILDLVGNYEIQAKVFDKVTISELTFFSQEHGDYTLERELTMQEKILLQLLLDYTGRGNYAATDLAVTGYAYDEKRRAEIREAAKKSLEIAAEINGILSDVIRDSLSGEKSIFYVKDCKLYVREKSKYDQVANQEKLSRLKIYAENLGVFLGTVEDMQRCHHLVVSKELPDGEKRQKCVYLFPGESTDLYDQAPEEVTELFASPIVTGCLFASMDNALSMLRIAAEKLRNEP